MNLNKSHYEVLGIDTHASEDEIKSAYRRLARTYHPDLNPKRPRSAHDRFRRLQEAYDVLSDPISRHQYDQSLGIHQINCPTSELEHSEFHSGVGRVHVDEEDASARWLDRINRDFIVGLLLAILAASWLVYLVNLPLPELRRSRFSATVPFILFFLGLGLILVDTFSINRRTTKREIEEDALREEILAMLPDAHESQRGLNEYVYQTIGKPGILSLQLTELQRVKEYLQRRIDARGARE